MTTMPWFMEPCSGPYVAACITYADDVDNLRLYQWCPPCLYRLSELLMARRKGDSSAYAAITPMVNIELAHLRRAWAHVEDKECVSEIQAAVRDFVETVDKYGTVTLSPRAQS